MPYDRPDPAAPRRRRSVAGPDPIDLHVAARLRLRRTLLGMSQGKLGEALDLTFQQVQKYERGSNRISASMLHHLAEALDVPISFFFDDMASGTESRLVPEEDIRAQREILLVMRHWVAIPGDIRYTVCNLIKNLGRIEQPA